MQVDTLGVYWGARRETPEQCAARYRIYLDQLAVKFSGLDSWHEKPSSGGQVDGKRSTADYSSTELSSLFLEGANRKDSDGQVIDDLGFRISLWNARRDASAMGLTINCGLFTEAKGLRNSVVIQLPEDMLASGLDTSKMKELLECTATVWEADCGAVFDSSNGNPFSRDVELDLKDEIVWLR